MTDVTGKWKFMGLILGYPACCIDMFCMRGVQILETGYSELGTSFQDDDGQDVGFIMCDDCAKKPRDELIAEINNERFPSLPPFPGPVDVTDLRGITARSSETHH